MGIKPRHAEQESARNLSNCLVFRGRAVRCRRAERLGYFTWVSTRCNRFHSPNLDICDLFRADTHWDIISVLRAGTGRTSPRPLSPSAKVSLFYTLTGTRSLALQRPAFASSPGTKILSSHAADLGYRRQSIALSPHRPRHMWQILESDTRTTTEHATTQ